MSKSFIRVLVSAAVAGFIAGSAVALYGMANQLQARYSFHLSDPQAAFVATLLAAFALATAVLVVRWIPDNKTMGIEDALLTVIAGVASIAAAVASFGMMSTVTSLHQLWLLPAVVCAIVATLVSVLPIMLGAAAVAAWVPDQATAKN